jgi:hypothetical protein
LVSAALAVVLCEMLLAWLDVPHETDQSNAGALFEVHEDYVRLRPGLVDLPFTGVPISTNAFGFRDAGMRREREPARRRIAVLGDSWGFGWGLPESTGLVAQLAGALAEQPGPQIELLNFSVPGYNIADHERVMRGVVPAFQPDHVLLLLHLNDIEPGLYELRTRAPSPPRSASWRERLMRTRLAKLVYARLALPLAVRFDLPNPGPVASFEREYGDDSAEWRAYRTHAEALIAACEGLHVGLSVVLLPIPFARNDEYPLQDVADRVLAFYAAHGVWARAAQETYRTWDQTELTLHALDPHPNAFAARELGREIARLLADAPGLRSERGPEHPAAFSQ